MFNARGSKILMGIADLAGLFALICGLAVAALGFSTGGPRAMLGVILAGSGFSTMIIAHIGQALIRIAETNSEIASIMQAKARE